MGEIRADAPDPDTERDLLRADKLARAGYYTEAAVRLGRAMESALFTLGRESGIDVRRRKVKLIADVVQSLEGAQAVLVRSRAPTDVRSLADVSRRLAECIADLTAQEALRAGVLDPEPRSTRALFKELRVAAADRLLVRQLGRAEELVNTIQERRNAGAHAAPEGGEREISEPEYREMRDQVRELLQQLQLARVGILARRPTPGDADGGPAA